MLVGVIVAVGVGVAPSVTDTTAEALLFPMYGSGSLPMTPTTAVSVPCDCGTTRITRLLSPAAAQVTVVDISADAVLAEQIPAGTDESSVTFGRNTAVTVTLRRPARAADPHGERQPRSPPSRLPAPPRRPTDPAASDPEPAATPSPATAARNPFSKCESSSHRSSHHPLSPLRTPRAQTPRASTKGVSPDEEQEALDF